MKRVVLLLAAAALLTAGLFAATAIAGNHASTKSGHVTICHRTGSHHNPYVVISPSVSGVYHGHYKEHNEHAVFPNSASDGKWGDIIPPFQYRGVTYSLNWNTDGQAIWNNGCRPAATGGGTTTHGGTTTMTTPGSTVTITTSGSTVTVTTPGTTTAFTPPPSHHTHHKKRHQRQTFTPPKVKLPHTT